MLTPEQYKVTRKKGTERAFSGKWWDHHADGTYTCVCCGAPLFDAATKFDSGTGWPSFYAPVDKANVTGRRRQLVLHAPHRGGLRRLRRAPGARVPRRPRADGLALLHELGVARLQAEGVAGPPPMRLLLAEDDAMIGAGIRQGLAQEGFAVDWVRDGAAAEHALGERVHELLLLDLGLPRKDGLDVLASMRRRGDLRPVLVLTARDAVGERVAGLDAGADDYLTKPFELAELVARAARARPPRAGRARSRRSRSAR